MDQIGNDLRCQARQPHGGGVLLTAPMANTRIRPNGVKTTSMNRSISSVALVALCVVVFSGVVSSQQTIPTGGPIPDIRGFNNRITDPDAVSEVSVVVRHVAGQVYVVAGAGGNVVVFAGDGGIFLVDTNFIVFYDEIMAAIRQISDSPIRFVVNTHSHLDHVQNNENMARQGAVIVAHPNLRKAMLGDLEPGSDLPSGLPVVTSSEVLTFHFNGEEVVFVPLKPAHTDGDAAVYFRGSDVWAFGDEYTTDYPGVNVRAGGTIENFVDNYNLALDMTTPNTRFVPGHGQLSNRAELISIRDVITTVHARFRDMVAQGMTLEQIREARPSREFDAEFAAENSSPTTFVTVERLVRQLVRRSCGRGGATTIKHLSGSSAHLKRHVV